VVVVDIEPPLPPVVELDVAALPPVSVVLSEPSHPPRRPKLSARAAGAPKAKQSLLNRMMDPFCRDGRETVACAVSSTAHRRQHGGGKVPAGARRLGAAPLSARSPPDTISSEFSPRRRGGAARPTRPRRARRRARPPGSPLRRPPSRFEALARRSP